MRGVKETLILRYKTVCMKRREALTGIVMLPAFAGLVASTTAIADAKGSKAQFKYQTHPHGNQRCGGCRFFHAGTSPSNGSCSVVDGPISVNGWCIAYAAK